MTRTDRFRENEEKHAALEQRLDAESQYGEQRQPMKKTAAHWRGIRRYNRTTARIQIELVRERFEEYGNISERICQ